MYVNYNYMPYALERKEDIKHSSVTAYTDSAGYYIVLHYSTVIFKLYKNGKKYFDTTKYSKGTNRVQRIIAKVFDLTDKLQSDRKKQKADGVDWLYSGADLLK